MTQPLALVFYENLLPGSQLVNKLQDLNYQVGTVTDAALLPETAEKSKPLLVLADLASSKGDVCKIIARLRSNPETKHLPIIAFAASPSDEMRTEAQSAGATMVVSEGAIHSHLPQLLDQALQVE